MREWIRSAAFIARADLGFMLRQRETLLWVFAMPLLFFYFIGTVTGGFAAPSAARPDVLALSAPGDSGLIVDELVIRLEQQNYRVERPATPEALQGFARRLIVQAPSSHATATAAVLAGEQLIVRFERTGDQLAS